MASAKPHTNIAAFLRLFIEQNRYRPTRIGVFEGEPGEMEDYWLEDGLPLAGLDLDPDGKRGMDVQIMLNGRGTSDAHMTHHVNGTRFVKLTLSASGEADGLEITNDRGQTTVLQFEKR